MTDLIVSDMIDLMLTQVKVSDVLWSAISAESARFQSLCGVPYTALPIATVRTTS